MNLDRVGADDRREDRILDADALRLLVAGRSRGNEDMPRAGVGTGREGRVQEREVGSTLDADVLQVERPRRPAVARVEHAEGDAVDRDAIALIHTGWLSWSLQSRTPGA